MVLSKWKSSHICYFVVEVAMWIYRTVWSFSGWICSSDIFLQPFTSLHQSSLTIQHGVSPPRYRLGMS
jgi:hypothetical protein